MAIRDEKTGTNQILGDARFTAAALTSDPDAKHLAKPVKDSRATLKTGRNTAEDKEDERIDGLAELTRSDSDLDEMLIDFEDRVYRHKLVKKNRDSEIYRAIIGTRKKWSAMLQLRGKEETRQVAEVLKQTKTYLPDLATEFTKPLLDLCKACEDKEETWLAAETAAAHASGDEFVARTNVVRMLQKTEGALTALYPGRRTRVRSYFRPSRKKAKVVTTTTTGGDAK